MSIRTWLAPSLIVTLLALPPAASAQTYNSEHHRFSLETIATGLRHPWSLVFLPGGEILLSERPGTLRRMVDGRLVADAIAGLPDITASGQGGLLDLALHPDFTRNRWLYFSYSHGNAQGLTTRVARGRYEQGQLTNVEPIFEALPRLPGGRHFGSRLTFDRQGYLFITVGDRGHEARAQQLDSHMGTMIRLHDDGRIPDDNPFIGQAGARPEIFTYGNRNGQGLFTHPLTGEIWQNEHGPRGGDEINIIRAGLNYGWPRVTYGINYNGTPITDITEQEGIEPPLLHWTPSIAPAGMAYYNGSVFPEWQGDVFVGALAGQKIQRVRFAGTEVVEQEDLLTRFNARIRDIKTGPDGSLWFITDEPNGRLMRFVPE